MFSKARTAQNEAQRHTEKVKTAEIHMASFFADEQCNIPHRFLARRPAKKKSFSDSKIVQARHDAWA